MMRELYVLHKYYLKNNLHHLRGMVLVHYCDNQGVKAIMAKGLPKDSLHNLACDIFVVTKHARVKLLVVWKRRSEEEMMRADLRSRGPWLMVKDFQLDFSLILGSLLGSTSLAMQWPHLERKCVRSTSLWPMNLNRQEQISSPRDWIPRSFTG